MNTIFRWARFGSPSKGGRFLGIFRHGRPGLRCCVGIHLLLLVTACILCCVSQGCGPGQQADESVRDLTLEAEPLPIGGDFLLTDHNGQTFHLAEQKGPVLLFFGYASCPDFCPQTLSQIAQVYAVLGQQAEDLQTIFVSVDPVRDTPDVLKTYLSHFGLPVIGLTGSKEEIDSVVKQYAAFYEVRDAHSAAGPLIDHSVYIYAIDREGRVRFLLRSTDTVKDMVTVIRQL
ncbi:MAG: SCO family protein [bacterium]|nr:SCO family protein [bacterium]